MAESLMLSFTAVLDSELPASCGSFLTNFERARNNFIISMIISNIQTTQVDFSSHITTEPPRGNIQLERGRASFFLFDSTA